MTRKRKRRDQSLRRGGRAPRRGGGRGPKGIGNGASLPPPHPFPFLPRREEDAQRLRANESCQPHRPPLYRQRPQQRGLRKVRRTRGACPCRKPTCRAAFGAAFAFAAAGDDDSRRFFGCFGCFDRHPLLCLLLLHPRCCHSRKGRGGLFPLQLWSPREWHAAPPPQRPQHPMLMRSQRGWKRLAGRLVSKS